MPALIRKSRIISLRLSEREFEALKTLYAAHGARSISDFVRSTMNRVICEAPYDPQTLELKVHEMDGKITVLDGEVARLTHLLENRHDDKKS
jgi:hypothetical protein